MNKLKNFKQKVKKYFKDYNLNFVIKYIEKFCKQEYTNKLSDANLLLDNIFIFDENWDMEPCDTQYCLNPIIWDSCPNGDLEWTYMLNRHEYLYKLLLAFYIENDSKYLKKLKFFIFDWIEKNSISKNGGNTIRTLDTGIRCMSWLNLILHMVYQNILNDDEILTIIKSIEEQLLYLKNSYIGKYTLSNWGVLQTTAICSNYLWFKDFFEDKSLDKWALEELYNQIQIQVFDDGSHWEQSIMYHIEVLTCCMKYIFYANTFKKKLDSKFLYKLNSMAEYVLYATAPNFKQECQGDSDSTDTRDIMTKASIIFNNNILKYAAFKNLDLDTIFSMGKSAYEKYSKIEIKKPTQLNKNCVDSGNIYVRSSFLKTSSYTYMKNGTLGSSHGHIDLTHISIYYKGKPFFIDSGRYSYIENEFRLTLKNAESHNVCVIDNCPHSKAIKSWEYSSYGNCLKNYYCSKDEITYIEMPYTAYLDNGTPYFVNRKVLIISPKIWFIVNDLQCSGKHSLKEYYNLDNEVNIYNNNDYIILKNSNAELQLLSKEKFFTQTGIMSKKYNSIVKNIKLIKQIEEFENQNINYDIIADKNIKIKDIDIVQFSSDSTMDEKDVIAKEFEISKNKSYIVIFFNKETYRGAKLYYYNNIPIYGKCIVLKKVNSKFKMIRLKS